MSLTHLLRRFFLWCSATDSRLIADLPRDDIHRHASVGATVFFTGALAALSGGYAFSTIFHDNRTAAAFGLFWGAVIFNLDRCLILTVEASKVTGFAERSRRASLFAVRLSLAIVIALVVARPLELRIFADAITRNLNASYAEATTRIDEAFTQRQAEISAGRDAQVEKERASLKSRDESLQQQRSALVDCRQKADELQHDYLCERDGTCGTRVKSCGPECKAKEDAWVQKKTMCDGIAATIEAQTKSRDDASAEIEVNLQEVRQHASTTLDSFARTRDEDLARVQDAATAAFLERHRALSELEQTQPAVRNVTWVVMLLMIILEIAPLLTKTLMPPGPYADAVDFSRHAVLAALKTKDQVELLAYQTVLDRARELLLPWRVADASAAQLSNELERRFERLWRGVAAPSVALELPSSGRASVAVAGRRTFWSRLSAVIWPAVATFATLAITSSGTAAISTGASVIAFVEFYLMRVQRQAA